MVMYNFALKKILIVCLLFLFLRCHILVATKTYNLYNYTFILTHLKQNHLKLDENGWINTILIKTIKHVYTNLHLLKYILEFAYNDLDLF